MLHKRLSTIYVNLSRVVRAFSSRPEEAQSAIEHMGRTAAIEYLSSAVATSAGRRLLDFMNGESRRGIATRFPTMRRAA